MTEDVTVATHRIAVIPGDGIGKEVVPEGVRVLDAAARKFNIDLKLDHFDWSCDYYAKHGTMMPENWKDQIGGHDALFFGACGWPATVPDHVSLWGMLIKYRREFDQYVNLRPCRLMPGIKSPLADRKPGDIDFFVVRENTEGEYSSVGGRMYADTDREIVFQQACFSRKGVDRILKFAFELAMKRPKKHLTSATKSNGISITMPYWDERVEAMAKQYPAIKWDKFHIDILTAHFVAHPDWFDVVVASHPLGPRPRMYGHDRHRTIGEHQPGACIPVAVRAGARLGAGYLRQGRREPDRPDLGGRDDARSPRPSRGWPRHREGDRDRARSEKRCPEDTGHRRQGKDLRPRQGDRGRLVVR